MTTRLPKRHPHVEQFLDRVRLWASAYESSVFSFVAIRRETSDFLLVTRLGFKAESAVRLIVEIVDSLRYADHAVDLRQGGTVREAAKDRSHSLTCG